MLVKSLINLTLKLSYKAFLHWWRHIRIHGQEIYEQFELPKDNFGDYAGYISLEDDLKDKLTFYEGKPVGIDIPVLGTLTITCIKPGVKDDISGKSLKPATLDTSIEVLVPLFINDGERIVIYTREGSFVERTKN